MPNFRLIAAIGVLFCCGGTGAQPLPQGDTPMPKTELKNEQIKTLYGTLAVPLTALLEKGDQAEAGRLLTEDIFPLHLRNLQNHTRPMRLVQLSVEELEEQLLASPQSDRLDVLKKALADAQTRPEEVGAINAHLTATGADPNEVRSWSAALDCLPEDLPPITSTKSMIGHALGAAGS